jgi:hypothetical protein
VSAAPSSDHVRSVPSLAADNSRPDSSRDCSRQRWRKRKRESICVRAVINERDGNSSNKQASHHRAHGVRVAAQYSLCTRALPRADRVVCRAYGWDMREMEEVEKNSRHTQAQAA